MKTLPKKRFEMLQRFRRFGVENASALPGHTPAGTYFSELDRIIGDFKALMAEQVDGEKRAAAGTKTRARKALREDIEAINRTARALAAEIPELNGKFRVRNPLPDPDLLALARAFGNYAAPWRDQFVTQGLPENFLDDLAADIAVFEAAREQKAVAYHLRASAARTLDELSDKGGKIVSRLDVVIRNVFRGDTRKLADWKRAKTMATGTPKTPSAEGETTEGAAPEHMVAA